MRRELPSRWQLWDCRYWCLADSGCGKPLTKDFPTAHSQSRCKALKSGTLWNCAPAFRLPQMLHPVLPAHQAYSVLADIERKIRNDVDQSPPGKSSEEARRKSARDCDEVEKLRGAPVVPLQMSSENVRVAKIAMAIAGKRSSVPATGQSEHSSRRLRPAGSSRA